MEDLSQNRTHEFSPSRSEGYGVRRRTALALDLANPSEKRNRIASLSDLALHELASPTGGPPLPPPNGEREKAAVQTPTPTQFLFPKNVTEEQEAYASGFEQALKEIYKEKGPPVALDASTDDKGLVCTEVSSIPVNIISTISHSLTTSTQASLMRVPQMLFSKSATPTAFGKSTVASGTNNCNSLPLNNNHSTPVGLLKTETMPQMSQGAAKCRSISEVPFDNGAFRSENLEVRTPNVLTPLQHLGGADRICPVQISAGKSAGGSNVGSWSSSDAPIPRVHSQGITILQNPHLAGPVLLTHNTVPPDNVPVCAKGFGNAVPVPDHAQTRIPLMFPAHSRASAIPPVYEPAAEFHGCGAQRMHFSPVSASFPASNMYPEMRLEIPGNRPWSAASSTAEPVSCGSWMSPEGGVAPVGVVNMDEQERMKLERKRAKNRIAAQRCQMRKLERIARLEDKAEKLREQNSKLLQTVDDLRAHITELKKQITAHASKGCRLMVPDVTTSIGSIVGSL